MMQLTIFDIELPKKKEEPKKLILETTRTDTLEAFLEDIGYDLLKRPSNLTWGESGDAWLVKGNDILPYRTKPTETRKGLLVRLGWYRNEKCETTIVEFDEEGNAFFRNITITTEKESTYRNQAQTIDLSISPMKPLKKVPTGIVQFVQEEKEIERILQKKSGYTARYLQEKKIYGCTAALLLIAPQIEQLDKAQYEFASTLFRWNPNAMKDTRAWDNIKGTLECFNRLTQPGTSPKTIFKTSKAVYSALKEETDLSTWDSFRKMDKFGRIRNDEVSLLYNGGYRKKEIEQISNILGKKYLDKPVFTLRSLLQYMDRIDMFEAISRTEGLSLLTDYLSMCSQLEIQPRIDGDSLKREHDIAARNCRNKRNEIMAKKMEGVGDRLRIYDYEEDIFLIRGIRSYDDLIDEANQQHNCVASYAERIVSGKSRIYVMRQKNEPDRSLITVELSPDGKEIRQKLLAYNRPIHNKAQTDFLNRWITFCRKGGNANKAKAA